jgi:hypothetical protein
MELPDQPSFESLNAKPPLDYGKAIDQRCP